ncbi:MAG: DUF6452 family protein [Duncaniella sp.]|nr:DUF6452 family protein [Duncaniella sp.]
MKRHLFHIISVLTGLHLIAGCSSSTGCTDNQNSLPLAGFYSISTGDKVTPDSIAVEGVGAPNDSLLLAPNKKVSELYLPFRSTKSTTSFCIQYRQSSLNFAELYDTLTFNYKTIPYFASEECGAMYHYLITSYSYTRHIVDSVALVDSLITNVDRETIQIYFRTSTPDKQSRSLSDEGTEVVFKVKQE